MNIVFCTTCKGRTQHLARTLPKNLADNPKAKFIVLSYGDTEDLESYLRTQQAAIDSGQLAVYQYKASVPFRMAHAKNMAHRLGIMEGAEVLVNLDADNFTGPGFADYVAEQFRGQESVFLWSRMIKEGKERLNRGISGRIAVRPLAFMLVGGYDEKYHTHSPDDKDFNARLRRLGYDGLEIDSKYLLAINHSEKMRYKEYPYAERNCYDDFRIDTGYVVVNGGAIGCGVVYKNFSSVPIEIKPVPTRIFGIGLHKTATTSLHKALSILGYKSGHWVTAHWAKSIWREMNQDGRSATLERYQALTDLPIPMLYKQLDVAYPGSKFILTVRDEFSWLDSVRRHFSYEHNPFRAQWDTDPFSNRVHQMLYGRQDFDAATCLERYRIHTGRVLEYFQGRSDLLVMNIPSQPNAEISKDMIDVNHVGWKALCDFLGMPVPTSPYPAITSKQFKAPPS